MGHCYSVAQMTENVKLGDTPPMVQRKRRLGPKGVVMLMSSRPAAVFWAKVPMTFQFVPSRVSSMTTSSVGVVPDAAVTLSSARMVLGGP